MGEAKATQEEWDAAIDKAAEHFRRYFPGKGKKAVAMRRVLSGSVLTLVQSAAVIPKSTAPNGVVWSVNGPGGQWMVSIQRPDAPLGFPGLYMKLGNRLDAARVVVKELAADGRITDNAAQILEEALRG